jgi:membrane protein
VAALRRTGLGRFAARFLADGGPELATLIAWGTPSTVFPVLLGITAVAGVLLRDPERSARLSATLLHLVPPEAGLLLGAILEDVRRQAGTWGVVGLVLLLFNGSNLFATMQSVFDRVYRVPHRGFVEARLISLLRLVIATALLLLSAVAYGIGGLLGGASDAAARALPFAAPALGPTGLPMGYGVSLLSALLTFLLLYRVLPNKRQTFGQVLPGSLLGAGLFFALLQVFPLYTGLVGRSFEAYAVFGMLLLLMVWTHLLALVLVLGAELNAFLDSPPVERG